MSLVVPSRTTGKEGDLVNRRWSISYSTCEQQAFHPNWNSADAPSKNPKVAFDSDSVTLALWTTILATAEDFRDSAMACSFLRADVEILPDIECDSYCESTTLVAISTIPVDS